MGRGFAAFPAPDRGALRADGEIHQAAQDPALQPRAAGTRPDRQGQAQGRLRAGAQGGGPTARCGARRGQAVHDPTAQLHRAHGRGGAAGGAIRVRGLHAGGEVREAGGVPGQPRLRLAGGAHDRGRRRRAWQDRRGGPGQDFAPGSPSSRRPGLRRCRRRRRSWTWGRSRPSFPTSSCTSRGIDGWKASGAERPRARSRSLRRGSGGWRCGTGGLGSLAPHRQFAQPAHP